MAKSVFTPVRTRTARARALAATLAMSLIAALLIPFTAAPAGAAPVTDLVIGAGRSGASFNLFDGDLIGSELTNSANFTGLGVTSVTLAGTTDRVTAEHLAGVDIFFDGWVYDSDATVGGANRWQDDEINSIIEWVNRGGVLVVTEDASETDPPTAFDPLSAPIEANELGQTLGVPTASHVFDAQNVDPAPVLGVVTGAETNPMVDGPFGTIASLVPFGTLGNLGPSGSLPAAWTPVFEDQDGNAIVAERTLGLGHIILTTDEGFFRTVNQAAALNIFAHAVTETEDSLVPITVDAQTDQSYPVGDPITDLTTGTTGGDASSPIAWRAAGLPPGLSVSSATGTISGTPTTGGSYEVVLTASPPTGLEGSVTFVITVGPIVVTPVADQTYRQDNPIDPLQMETTGGDGSAITWSGTGLPAGLSIDPGTGIISGTPTTVSSGTATITATQGADDDMVDINWTITENQLPVAVADSVTVDVDEFFTLDLCANDTVADTPTTATITGTPPAGVDQDGCGLEGTPTLAGTTNLTYVLTDDDGDMSAPAAITITVNPLNQLPVAVADELTVDFGDLVNLNICANDTLGDTPTTAAITGTLPAGVTQAGCVLSGTPAAAGTTNLTYVLTDVDGDMSAPAGITIVVNPAPDPDPGPDPDPVFCRGREATIVGTDGPDILTGTDGPDVIVGLGGNDTIRGAGGDDLICAGAGNDTVFGGSGADEIWGYGGDDTLRGGSGGDTIQGGSGADDIRGNKGRDTIRGGSGRDTIHGGSFADDIRGNKGRDTIQGAKGDDTIHGGSGADDISGGSGDDGLSGGSGADSLDGGSGTDTCNGGSGSDTATACETRISAIRFI